MAQTPQPVNTIGVLVGRDLVGDALMKLPFLRALRAAYSTARIYWISTHGSTAFASLLRDATRDLIDVVVEGETGGWRLEAEKSPPNLQPQASSLPFFDLLIDTRNRWKEAVQAKKLPHRIFLAMALHYVMSDQRPALSAIIHPPEHICDRLLLLVEMAAGYRPASQGALPVSPELQATARRILPPGAVYIGLAPGAGNPVKIWPRYKFEQVAAHQMAAGRVPVFLLGPQELPWHEELRAAIPAAKFPLQEREIWQTDQMTLDHTLAIASLLDVAVANDSGVGHMLAAVDCKLISLFGPTSPAKLAPRVSHGKVIRAQDFGGHNSMPAIPVEVVDAAIEAMLSNH